VPPSFGIFFFRTAWVDTFVNQFVLNLFQKILHSVFLNRVKGDPIDPRCAIITLGHLVGFLKSFHLADVTRSNQNRSIDLAQGQWSSAFFFTNAGLCGRLKRSGEFK
jgi:hypothetical protein